MIWDTWVQRWNRALDACRVLGGDSRELIVGKPAETEAVAAVERELALEIPASFKRVLTGYAAQLDFTWSLPRNFVLPDALRDVRRSRCNWDLSRLVEVENTRRRWADAVFPNREDPYDRVWHDK